MEDVGEHEAQIVAVLHNASLRHREGDRGGALAEAIAAAKRFPGDGRPHHLRGMLLAEAGQWAAAAEAHAEAVRLDPGLAAAHHDHALASYNAGEMNAAVSSFRAALALRPDWIDAHAGLGVALRRLGQPAAALQCYERALALNPNLPGVLSNRGNALLDLGQPAAAMASFEAALRLEPNSALAHNNLANVLLRLDRPDEALVETETALGLAPDFASAHYNRGNALMALDRFQEAAASYGRALALRPDYPEALNNRAGARLKLGDAPGALDDLASAARVAPLGDDARFNRALALLALGRFREGWRDYEHRWGAPAFISMSSSQVTAAAIERLSGRPDIEALAGKSVLVIGEQGIGDVVMFASALPDLLAIAGSVTVLVEPRLQRLFAASFPQANVVDWSSADPHLAGYDEVLAMGSLGRLFRNEISDFPGKPYLRPGGEVGAAWSARLGPKTTARRVGLSWRGGSKATGGMARSVDWHALAPLLRRADCEFISLQYGDVEAEVAAVNTTLDRPVRVFPRAEIEDFEDLAALVLNLDFVVTVQTALAHLSGALGQQALVMLPRTPEWRYASQPRTMPWYASLELFRQPAEGGWTPVIAEIGERLG